MNKRDLEIGRIRRQNISANLQKWGRELIDIKPLSGRGFQVTHILPGQKRKLNTPNGRSYGDDPFKLGQALLITDIKTQKSAIFEIRIFADGQSCASSYLKAVSEAKTIEEATAPFKDRIFLNFRGMKMSHYSIFPVKILQGRMYMGHSKGNKNRINLDTKGFEPNTPVCGRRALLVNEDEPDIITAILRAINQ